MKPMNSETHSCIASFASFAIFAFPGSAFFIILQEQQIQHPRSDSSTIQTETATSAPRQ
jgi:hypothetical protein